MNAEVVLQKKYMGYEIIVRKVSYEPGEIKPNIFNPIYHRYFGYVVIPGDNPFYGVDYNPLKSFIHVSGGLSYSGRIDGIDGYVIGFNCDHTWNDPHIQVEEYTLNECERLVVNLLLLEGLINEINSNNKAEEKKFYAKHKFLVGIEYRDANYLNFGKYDDDKFWLGFKDKRLNVQTQFTLKEIENIEKEFDIDLKDFELVKVEDD